MRKKISLLLIGAVLFSVPFINLRAYNTNAAENYLKAHSSNPWSTIGLAALGAKSIPDTHLKSISGSSALDFALPVLAISALGQNPRTFGSLDYIDKLKSYYQNGQLGEAVALNDDIFGLLALLSAGEPLSDSVVSGTKNHILSQQNSDGGWSFIAGSSSDTNMTAAAICALLAAGVNKTDTKIQNALNYLRNAQNNDGGFPYDPNSSFGRASDSSSTAWVIWALNSAGINPTAWSKPNGNPISYLESTQNPNGYFEYQKGAGENSFSPTNTAYAVIALSGKTLPLASFSQNRDAGQKFGFKILGSGGVICEGQTQGPTALDIVKNGARLCNYTYVIQNTSFGPYLSQINSDAASGLLGWLYLVNCALPSVGASDYNLQSGDFVLWYYGEWNKPPVCGSQNESAQSAVELSVNIVKPAVQEIIAFSVTPSQINFGNLEPGQTASQNVNISNTGNVDLDIKSSVNGDVVFSNNLSIGNVFWTNYQTMLAAGTNKTESLTLTLPANYQGADGQKNGQIIFWASKR